MCGIAGILTTESSGIHSSVLQSLNDTLRDRGPDNLGFLGWGANSSIKVSRDWRSLEGCWLGLVHRRLSILDRTSAGWQPMGTSDGRYYIVFNGEIYNYLELQNQLKELGNNFRSHSDTEVLLTAYAQWGSDALTSLVGMFAFAILDTQNKELFLARDFFGIKPLYYTYYQNGFVFASEIKALLKIPGIDRRVNPQRLYDYLRSGLTDYGSETLFANIRQLPPAHFLKLSLDKPQQPQIQRYWQLESNQHSQLSFSEAASHLRKLFLENITLHLRSDVPVGAALSGGIDSSAIVMAMRHLNKNQEIHTFSYIAEDKTLSEEKWVDLVAQKAGCIGHKVRALPQELKSDLARLIELQDEPFGSTSIYAQYRVFQTAKRAGIKVMLDGQGADEILGGYRPYIAARFASLVRQGKWSDAIAFLQKVVNLPGASQKRILMQAAKFLLPPSLQLPLRQLVKKDLMPIWLNAKWFDRKQIEIDTGFQNFSIEQILREQLYRACTETSLPMLLRYEDRNSMAHSIESRVPFLTPALVNFVFSLPEEFIIAKDGTSKAIFRQAMRGIVPDPILDRKDKIGFATPEQSWLSSSYPWVDKILQSKVAAEIPAFNLEVLQAEFQAVLQGRSPFDFRVWRWVNSILWVEKFNISFDD